MLGSFENSGNVAHRRKASRTQIAQRLHMQGTEIQQHTSFPFAPTQCYTPFSLPHPLISHLQEPSNHQTRSTDDTTSKHRPGRLGRGRSVARVLLLVLQVVAAGGEGRLRHGRDEGAEAVAVGAVQRAGEAVWAVKDSADDLAAVGGEELGTRGLALIACARACEEARRACRGESRCAYCRLSAVEGDGGQGVIA